MRTSYQCAGGHIVNHPNRGQVRDWPAYIKLFRVRHDLSQIKLAEHLRVDETTVQRWESGESTPKPYLKRALRDLSRELSQGST